MTTLTRHTLIPPCNSWDCPECGQRKIRILQAQIHAGKPTRFLTLTTRPKDGDDPHEVHKNAIKAWTSLRSRMLRITGNKIEYVRVLELTKRGYPHYHILFRGPWWDRQEVKRTWERHTGAYIVDIRRITSERQAVRYVTKYISKSLQGTRDWDRQRVSFSKNYLPRKLKPQHDKQYYEDWSALTDVEIQQRQERCGHIHQSGPNFAHLSADNPDPLIDEWLHKRAS